MARTLNRLGNAKHVAALKAPGMHADGGGLYLRIRPEGTRSWVLVRQAGGKRVERGLGSFDSISLADVRERARNYQDAVEAPAEKRIPTFGEFTEEILPTFLPGFKNAKHRQQWENTLKTYCKPTWGKRIDEVTTDDVLAVLRPIWIDKPETASRVRGRMERIFGAAKAARLRPIDSMNPAAWDDHLSHFLSARTKRVKHHAAMPFADLPAFLAKLRANGSVSARALELCILTACRTIEVIAARHHEFDLERLVWTIPQERMKMGIAHEVPLTPRMVEIVKGLSESLSPTGYLFPGQARTDREPHLSNMAMTQLLRGMVAEKWTVHGFRSSFRDWAGDATDHPREVAEMALAHSLGSGVEAAYRRGRALEKRRALMQDWEKYLAPAVAKAPTVDVGSTPPSASRCNAKGRGHPDQVSLLG